MRGPPDLASLPSGAALPAPRQVLPEVQVALGFGVDPLVEALVADPHHGVAGVLQLRPALDQLGAPSTAQRVHHPRAQPVRVHAPRFAGLVALQVGPPLRREGGVERHGRPRAGLQPFRPVRAVGFVLVGREPRSPFRLVADGGLVPADQPGRFPDAQTLLAMQPLDPDPLVRGQVRITCTHECNTSSWNLDTSNPRQVLHFYLEPAGHFLCTCRWYDVLNRPNCKE